MNTAFYPKDHAALTPPMGWNSWDCYAAAVTEEQLLANARYMRDHLKEHGWEYVVCDIQWSEPLAGTEEGEYRAFAPLHMDEFGRLIPAENRFPSAAGGKGFAPIADQIHEMGLKFGIHIMRGIPRQAVHARVPVKGTAYTADMVASPFSISKWNGDMYGLRADHPGGQAYYDSLFELYAQWHVDFVKVDDICNTNMYPHNPYSAREEIECIRRAIDRCGRQMVLSLSPGPAIIDEAWHLEKHANMWRITDDFWDKWDLLKDMFHRCEVWQAHVGPGCWPDCDMLPLGHIGMGFHSGRTTRFTRDEQRTMMTLWSIFRSPLMMGGEMNDNDEWTLSLLTNDDVLRVQRRGGQPRQLEHDENQAVWYNRTEDGEEYVALFNLSDEEREVVCPLSVLRMENASLRDAWEGKTAQASGQIACRLAPHACAMYIVTPAD